MAAHHSIRDDRYASVRPCDISFTRRHFIFTAASAAGGLMIGIGAAPRAAHAAAVPEQPWNDDHAYEPNEIDAWIAIDPDDSILIRYQRSEMGQGSMTALPMIIAEELHCDWSKVRIEYASPNRNFRENNVYGPMFSHGSQSVRASQKKMQQVGASARERLVAAAAARWNVPASECSAALSVVTHKPSSQSLRFGELAADAAKITLAGEPAIKTPANAVLILRIVVLKLARLSGRPALWRRQQLNGFQRNTIAPVACASAPISRFRASTIYS